MRKIIKKSLLLKAKSYKLKAGGGFTLIELLTAVAVIGIVSSFVLVNLNTGKKQKDIERAAQKLMLDIRKAQNLSLSPSETDNCIYGVYRKSGNSYILYKRSKNQCFDGNYKYVGSGQSSELETVSLPSGISWAGGSGRIRDVAFEGPEPITYLCVGSSCTPSSSTSGTIKLDATIGSKSITVNRFGMVEVQ